MFKILNFLFILLVAVACGGKEINNAAKKTGLKDSTTINSSAGEEVQEISEKGLLQQVEDSGYPFATLTIDFPERNLSESFTVNMEAIENASITDLNSYIGKYVKFAYTTEMTHTLLDLFHESKSIFGSEAAPEGEGIKAIEGLLHGAEQTTNGDIPGEVSVFADDGENIYFEYFITQEMVAFNEKRVTAFYELRVSNTIKSIKLVK